MSRPVDKRYPINFPFAAVYDDPRLPSFLIGKKHLGNDYLTPMGTETTTGVNGILNFWGNLHGYGNTVITKFWMGVWPLQETYRVLQCHLSGFNCLYKIGQKISKDQVVAFTGGQPNTPGAGWSTGPHQHYQVEVLMLQKPDYTWTKTPGLTWRPINTKWVAIDPSFVVGKS